VWLLKHKRLVGLAAASLQHTAGHNNAGWGGGIKGGHQHFMAAAAAVGGNSLCDAQLLAVQQAVQQVLVLVMHQAGITLDQLLGKPRGKLVHLRATYAVYVRPKCGEVWSAGMSSLQGPVQVPPLADCVVTLTSELKNAAELKNSLKPRTAREWIGSCML
jgi:hypothetical protein